MRDKGLKTNRDQGYMDKSYGNLLVFQIKNTKETKDSNPEVETGFYQTKFPVPGMEYLHRT